MSVEAEPPADGDGSAGVRPGSPRGNEDDQVLRRVGSYTLPESKMDGNHVMLTGTEPTWKRQLMLLGGYAAFYNPINLLRALKNDGSRLRRRPRERPQMPPNRRRRVSES